MKLYKRSGEVIAITKFNKEHFKKIKKYKWSLSFYRYIETTQNWKMIKLHRYIQKNEEIKNMVIDHKDRDPLNNLDYNLRIVTQRENTINNSSKNYTFDKKSNKWVVQLMEHRKNKYHAKQ